MEMQETLDAGKHGQIFRLSLYTETMQKDFFMRPIWMLDGAPGLKFVGKVGRRSVKSNLAVSLPLYSKFTKLRIDQIPMSKLLIKLKDIEDVEMIKFFKESIQNNLDKQGLKDKYEVWSFKDTQDNTREVSQTVC